MGGLQTKGNKIVNGNGEVVHFNGISWFGMEGGNFAPLGIWQRSMDSMLDQIKSLGYNLLRIPYCNEMFDAGKTPSGIDFSQNADLQGKTAIEILDILVAKCKARGIYIFLDRHQMSHDSGWELWYNDQYPQDRWIKDWVMLATRYKGNDTIIGGELHNEPHGQATWQNWAAAATQCGNAILAANPDWLILVQGVESYNGNFNWWGGNLQGVKDLPVALDVASKLVYTAHDYGQGVSNQSWFQDPTFPKNLPDVWSKNWEYIHEQEIAPVMLTEFGGRDVSTTGNEGQWQNALVDYIKAKDLYWSYWCLNPNSGDTGGILQDDWVTVHQDKQTMLERIFQPLTQPTTTQPTTTPEVPQTPATPPVVTPQTQPTTTPTAPDPKPVKPVPQDPISVEKPTATPSTPAPVPQVTTVEKLVFSPGEAIIISLLCVILGLFTGALSMWIALH